MNTCNNIANVYSGGQEWFYSKTVKDHFLNPRNFLIDEKGYEYDGLGTVGSPACGDMMNVFIKVYKDKDGLLRIKDLKWQTFGCASAIASTSVMSEMVLKDEGFTLKRAKRLKPQEILEQMGGLPDRKFHCSVLGHEALREAVLDYEKKNNLI